MSMIKCPDCQAELSDRAAACPRCGAPTSKSLPPALVDSSYRPQAPGFELSAANILISAAALALGVYLIRWYIPEHLAGGVRFGPAIKRELIFLREWIAQTRLVSLAYGGALILAVCGLLSLLTGSLRRAGKLAWCPRCDRKVVAWRGQLSGWRCERCKKKLL